MSGHPNPFPGVSRQVDRHGKLRWRYRKRHQKDAYLPGTYGSAEFRAAYEALKNSKPVRKDRALPPEGTLAWLISSYLGSARFTDLSEIRKKTLRRELDWLRQEAGELPFFRFETRHVEALMGRKTGPTAANTVKKNLSMLFNYAIKKSLHGQKTNPARTADRRKEAHGGYHTWTQGEIAQFLSHHKKGSKARLAMLIFLCTGASRQDAARLKRDNIKENRLSYARGKTHVGTDLPILPELAEELDLLPKDQGFLLTHSDGGPYRPETLGNWFRDKCISGGLSECPAHGLRKAGATEWEIAGFPARKNRKTAETYIRLSSRARVADNGMARLKKGMTSGLRTCHFKPEWSNSDLLQGCSAGWEGQAKRAKLVAKSFFEAN